MAWKWAGNTRLPTMGRCVRFWRALGTRRHAPDTRPLQLTLIPNSNMPRSATALATLGALARTGYGAYKRNKSELRWLYRTLAPKKAMPYRRPYKKRRTMSRRRPYYRRKMRRYGRRRYKRRYGGRSLRKRTVWNNSTRTDVKVVETARILTSSSGGSRSLTVNIPTEWLQFDNNWEEMFLQQFYYKTLPYPRAPTDAKSEWRRDNNKTWFSGVKICRAFRNRSASYPIVVHWALLQAKDAASFTNRNNSSNGIMNRFFRTFQSSNDQSASFENTIAAADDWDSLMMCHRINPEAGWKPLVHKSFTLMNNVNDQRSMSHRKIEQYFKINKHMTFNDNTATVPTTPIVEVMWATTKSPQEWPADPTTANAVETWCVNKVYFRD